MDTGTMPEPKVNPHQSEFHTGYTEESHNSMQTEWTEPRDGHSEELSLSAQELRDYTGRCLLRRHSMPDLTRVTDRSELEWSFHARIPKKASSLTELSAHRDPQSAEVVDEKEEEDDAYSSDEDYYRSTKTDDGTEKSGRSITLSTASL